MAVHRSSGFELSSPLISWKYPNLSLITTEDLHGRCDDSDLTSVWGIGRFSLGINSINSYMPPSVTFDNVIWPILQASNAGQSYQPSLVASQPRQADVVQHLDRQAAPDGGRMGKVSSRFYRHLLFSVGRSISRLHFDEL
jgi:hypothetical protein